MSPLKRLAAVLHRDHRKVGDEQRHDQFTRLQLVDLPFAHNANSQNNRKIQDDRAHKRNKHGVFFPYVFVAIMRLRAYKIRPFCKIYRRTMRKGNC